MIAPGQMVIKRLKWDTSATAVGIVLYRENRKRSYITFGTSQSQKECLVMWMDNFLTVTWHYASMLREIESDEDVREIREQRCFIR